MAYRYPSRCIAGSFGGACLTNRTAHDAALLGDGYATLGVGARAASDAASEGAAFDTSERVEDATGGQVFARRTGVDATQGIVHLGIAQLVAANEAELFDAKVGGIGRRP